MAANIAELGGNEAGPDYFLANTFAQKSTNALSRRASSLGLYLRWANACGVAKTDFLTEPSIYAYLAHLRASSAPATRASGLL